MRRLIALFAACALVLLVPASASASVTQYATGTCTFHWHAHGDTVPFVCLTESITAGGDKLVLTGSSDISNLGSVAHSPGGLCSPKTYGDDNWNDCISSVWAKLGTNDSLCLYENSGYNVIHYSDAAPGSPSGGIWTYSHNLSSSANDESSSVMLQQSGTPCHEGGV